MNTHRYGYPRDMVTAQHSCLPLGNPPPLATTRLRLRVPGADDAATIAGMANDWEIARRMARLPHPYGIDDARFFLRDIVPSELAWAITSAPDGILVGIAGLVPDGATKTVELGYWLGRRYWGRGLATEAAQVITRYGLEILELPVITSGCFTDNLASRRVLAKIGFGETGVSERSCLAVGGNLPFIEMRIERPDRSVEQFSAPRI